MAKKADQPDERIMISRRIRRELWERFQDRVASITPRSSDTAVLEMLIERYLQREEED